MPVPILPASEVVALYGAAWQELDERARRDLLERCRAQDGIYCDPTTVVHGRDEDGRLRRIVGFFAPPAPPAPPS
jgi:hypothetical protein